MNTLQNYKTYENFVKNFQNKDILNEIFINEGIIKFSNNLNELFYYYFINEIVFLYCKNNNKDFITFLKNNNELISNIFFDFLDKFIIKNIFKLIEEYEEYRIFEGYEEIISLFVFDIYNEDLNFDNKNGKLVLSKDINKKLKKVTDKLNKFIKQKFLNL